MKSISTIYKIGHGPSSSHTMGPAFAAERFIARCPDAERYKVILYGSLAKTGRGHHTDKAILGVLGPGRTTIVFDTQTEGLPHENTMDFFAYSASAQTGFMRAMSVGGGEIEIDGEPNDAMPDIYKENSFKSIAAFCEEHDMRISDYVYLHEGDGIKNYLAGVWEAMTASIATGLSATGILEGGLGVERKAKLLFNQRHIDESDATRENRMVCAYAFAVGEQNAAGDVIVTAPTCGSCSVMPAVLKYMQLRRGFSDEQIIDGLAAAGIIGNLVKTNASISGAECGCQAEIGTACSMAAAALAEIFQMDISQIEYAAEVAMEHHLGLTCDPIRGLVQIPCIERGAVAAMRAINALSLANFLSDTRKISFDLVINTMYETGKDMKRTYRETSEGGLAKLYM